MITQSQSQTLRRGSVSIPLSRTSLSTPSKQTKYQSKVQFRCQSFAVDSEAEAIFNYPSMRNLLYAPMNYLRLSRKC